MQLSLKEYSGISGKDFHSRVLNSTGKLSCICKQGAVCVKGGVPVPHPAEAYREATLPCEVILGIPGLFRSNKMQLCLECGHGFS